MQRGNQRQSGNSGRGRGVAGPSSGAILPQVGETLPLRNERMNTIRNLDEYGIIQAAANFDEDIIDNGDFERFGVTPQSVYYAGDASIYTQSIGYRIRGFPHLSRIVLQIVNDMQRLAGNDRNRIRIFYNDREVNPDRSRADIVYDENTQQWRNRSQGNVERTSIRFNQSGAEIDYLEILRAILLLMNSNEQLEMNQLELILDLSIIEDLRGAARVKVVDRVKWKYNVRKVMEHYAKYLKLVPKMNEGYCGFAAILLHTLKYSDIDTCESKFGISRRLFEKMTKEWKDAQSRKKLYHYIWANDNLLLDHSKDLTLNIFDINSPVFDPKSEHLEKIMNVMKKCKIKIFLPSGGPIYEKKGSQYNLGSGDEFNICLHLDSSEKHYHYIDNPKLYNQSIHKKHSMNTKNVVYCHECDRTFARTLLRHQCQVSKCDKCNQMFDHEAELHRHQNPEDGVEKKEIPPMFQEFYNKDNLDLKDLKCHNCKIECYSVRCLLHHVYNSQSTEKCISRIRRYKCEKCMKLITQYAEHSCTSTGYYKCQTCKVKFLKSEFSEHRCDLRKSKKRKLPPLDEELLRFYAFDFESLFREGKGKNVILPNGEVVHIPEQIHKVNFVCVRQCGSGEEWSFTNIKEFLDWVMIESDNHAKQMVMIAHNLKGYDGRLIYDYFLNEAEISPWKVLWNGSKILSFTIPGNIKFADSLCHIQSGVSEMPKIFGLDPDKFCKGFFPYLFNTEENQNYIGPIPHYDYFDPDMMKPNTRTKFFEWYNKQTGLYDFHQELVKYCKSDVHILSESLEVYIKNGMEVHNLNPFNRLTIASFSHQIYESHRPEGSLKMLKEHEYLTAKAAMFGGRTDVRRMHVEYELGSGKYAKYLDVQSLYPYVQFCKPMPTGKPKIYRDFDTVPNVAKMMEWFGFVIVDIEPTEYLHHPVLVKVKDGKLCATLEPLQKYSVTTAELQVALRMKYKVTKVWEYHEYTPSLDLFKSYFRLVLKGKIEASGLPPGCDTDEKFQEYSQELDRRLGIKVSKENMIKNPGAKALNKLTANSLWGKFAESTNYMCTHKLDNENMPFFSSLELKGLIDTKFTHHFNDGKFMCTFENLNTKLYNPKKAETTNMAMAAFVTAWGRLTLWEEMNKLGKQVLYHDTDSIIYEYDENDSTYYDIQEGKFLGEWEDETGGKPILKFVSLGPKTYAYAYQDGNELKYECKSKGFTLNYSNAEKVNYDSMVKMVKREIDMIETEDTKFNWDKNTGQMVTFKQKKFLKCTYDKGHIDKDLNIYPFGADKFMEINF